MDVVNHVVAGMLVQVPLALVGMMSAFMWATWLERKDTYGADIYRGCAIVALVAMFALPVAALLMRWTLQ